MSTKGTTLSGISDDGLEAYAYHETSEMQVDFMGNNTGYNTYFSLSPGLFEFEITDAKINIKILEDLKYDWNKNRLPKEFKLSLSGVFEMSFDNLDGLLLSIKGGSYTSNQFYALLQGVPVLKYIIDNNK